MVGGPLRRNLEGHGGATEGKGESPITASLSILLMDWQCSKGGQKASDLWGLMLVVRQDPDQVEEEESRQSEMEGGAQVVVEEEGIAQARDRSVDSQHSPAPLSPRTRWGLKREEQR